MKVFVLAAGYATRLYPLTKTQPKPLLPIAGRPIIDYLLDQLIGISNIDEVVVISNACFYEHFVFWKKKLNYPYKITILNDGSTDDSNKLGAIGDILFAFEKVSMAEDLLILAGDNIFDFSLSELVKFGSKRGPTIGAYELGDIRLASQYGVLKINDSNRIIEFFEKPKQPTSQLVSTGVYYYPKNAAYIFQKYIQSGGNKDAPGFFVQWLINFEPSFAYTFSGDWFDIGDMERYQEAELYFSKRVQNSIGEKHYPTQCC